MVIHLNKLKWLPCFLFLIIGIQAVAAAEVRIGNVEFVRGTVVVKRSGQDLSTLGKGEEIFQGDNIQTSKNSFTVIFFNDGAKITIRPQSSLDIDLYQNSGDNPMADLSLHRGGLKISTGEIARKKPDNFKIHTDKATVKASKANYTVRVCGEDCAREIKKLKPLSLSTNQTVIARVVEIKGAVTAKAPADADDARLLRVGAPLYSTDRVDAEAGSHAVIVFRDESRLTIQPGSSFEIKDYTYKAENKKNVMKLGLIRGGLRSLTGLIGKMNKKAFSVETPVLTVGIRGTGFDMMFILEKDGPEMYKVIGVARSEAPGVYVYVWDGAIVEKNDAGEFDIAKGQVSFTANKDEKPEMLTEMPVFFKVNPNPRPDQLEIDMNNLFATTPVDGSKPGVYVTVEKGHVKVVSADGTPIDLGKTEAAFIDLDGNIVRMEDILNFQLKDPYPMPSRFSPETAEVIYSLLIDNYDSVQITGDTFYNCRCD